MSQQLIINPFPKQQEAWEALLDSKHTYVVYGGAAGGGKGVTLNSLVLTDTGWKKAKDITLKDRLVAVDGTYTKIKGIFPQGIKQTYKFTFDDGAVSIVDNSHLWKVWNSDHGKRDGWIIRDTETLFKTKGRFSIPLLENPVPGEYKPKYDPYIIGYILGDGTMTGAHPTIYTADEWTTEYLKKAGWKIYKYKESVWQCALSSKKDELYSELERNSKQNKRVPKNLLNGTPEVRLAVLQGLMDSDGTVQKDGSCSYSTLVDGLAEDVVYLVRSLGGKASIEVKKRIMPSGYTEKDVRVSHCGKFMPFRLPRKIARVKKAVYDKRYIKKIEKLGLEETVCFAVEHKEHLFVIDGFVVTHNSWLGCEWLLVMCLKYPGSRWFIGRDELKKIMTSAFITFTKVCSFHKISPESWKVNGQYNYIEFSNGSRIDLLDMKLLPTDPMFERFGSMEYTGGWLEEAGELHANAFEILKSRIGRHMADECPPKVLITCNPKKNWLYYDFYIPWKEGKLPDDALFIPALFGDNPYTKDIYGKQLMNLKDHIMRQRLEYGNWDYDDDNTNLLSYDEISSLFTNKGTIGDKFMTVDPAFAGKDEAVIMLWNGWVVYKIISIPKTDHGTLMQLINLYAQTENVPKRNIVSDAAGEGGYLPQMLKGIRGFLGGSSPLGDKDAKYKELEKPYFANLRTQCIYEMAHLIKQGKVQMATEDNNIKTKVIQELQQWRVKAIDDDKKLAIISKDDIRRTIGRSTDYSDALYMRMFFDLDTERPGITQETARKQLQVQREQPFNKYGI